MKQVKFGRGHYRNRFALGVFLALVGVSKPALTDERHIAKGQHEPVYEQGNKAEQEGDRLLDEGDDAGAKAKYREAIGYYNNVLALKQDYLPAYMRLSRVYGVLKEYLPAAGILKRGLAFFPDNLDLKEQLGGHLLLGGYEQEAVPLLEDVAAQRPGSVGVQALLADHYKKTGQAEKAIVVLTRILEAKPRADNRRVELGNALLRLNRTDEAKAQFAKVPANSNYYSAAQMGLGDVYLRTRHVQDALNVYAAIEKQLDPKSSESGEVALRIAQSLREAGEFNAALERYQIHVKRWPKDSRGYYGAGECYRRMHRYDEAIAMYQYSLNLYSKSAQTHTALARCYVGKGNFDSALQAQQRAIEMAPTDWQLPTFMATIYRRKGDVAKALAMHEELARTRAWSGRLAEEIGHDHYYLGNRAKALAAYEQALSKDANLVDARRGIVSLELKRIHELVEEGKLEQAQRQLSALKRYKIYDQQVSAALAAIHLDQGNAKDALRALDVEIPEGTAANWIYAVTKARAHIALGQGKEAIAVLDTADVRSLSSADLSSVQLTRAAAEILNEEYDAAISRLRDQSESRDGKKLLAQALLARGSRYWKQGDSTSAVEDLAEVVAAKNDLPSPMVAQTLLIHAISAAEAGRAEDSNESMKTLTAGKQPIAQDLIGKQLKDKKAWELIQGYVRYRNGTYDEALPHLRAVGGSRGDMADARNLYEMALRSALVNAYDRGDQRRAADAAKNLKQVLQGKLTPADEYLLTCIDYQGGKQKAAADKFRELSGQVPEAQLAMGIYEDDISNNERAAYDAYLSYLRRGNARAAGRVREWVAIKERIFGFKEEAAKEATP